MMQKDMNLLINFVFENLATCFRIKKGLIDCLG